MTLSQFQYNTQYMFRILTVLFIGLGISFQLNAQPKPVKPKATAETNDPEAEKILSAMKKYYNGLSNYSFSFSATASYPNTKKTDNFDGSYIAASSNKFFLKWNKMEIFSDGNTLVNINHNSKEIQLNDAKAQSGSQTPFDFISNYKKLFKYRVKEVLKNNKIIIELVPLQKNSNIFKIDLGLNKSTNQISSVKLYERSGVLIYYSITNQLINTALSANQFSLNENNFKGYEIVDLK